MTDSIQKMRDLPATHLLGSGTSMCAGCGGLGALHEIYDVIGENNVIVNAAGCMTMLATYPFTPFRGSWLFTSMASAPAGAQGVRDALDILIQKKRIPASEDLSVLALAGDGSSYGMGLSATSAAIERGLDFLYICYDNEGYGNTGQQSSDATPRNARTATSSGTNPGKKDLFAIWTAHRPAYAATVIGAEPLDLAQKIEKAKQIRGPKLILALAPCPTGWESKPEDAVELGRLAVRTGIWQLKEYQNGQTRITKDIPHRLPVEEYLKLQGRFAHLFSPQRNDSAIAAIQREVDELWKNQGV
jgi:pyruvate ferredoxin oxidoreductase beta subunit